ncbi:MAG: hypothetical protein LIO97_07550 [Tannerellaceae bacterium]|nr:hypothetical protein [Tannerellaceae bacterium]
MVNYKQLISSGELFTLANEGEQALEIRSLSFSTSFFATTLTPGLIINANQEIKFSIIFSSVEPQKEVRDTLVIEFTDGQTATSR